MFQLKECIFWTKVAHQISTFWTFHCLPEVSQIPHVIFETRSQFLQNFCIILYIISQLKTSVKFKWNFLETLIQSVQRSLNLLFQHAHFLMFPLFQKYVHCQVRTNKLVVLFTTFVLQYQPQGCTLFSLNSLGFYLVPECFLNFL